MHFDVDARTILLVRHGSHAYGLNTPESDEDFKGVCIKPAAAYFGFTQRFEQMEHMGSKSDGIDKVVYSIEKFVSLAADCNPNIIEVLHVDESDIVKIDSFGEELRSIKDTFLSKKAKFTFAGYANAQLKRILTHRAWLLDPPKAPPERKDFGLSETQVVSKSELGAFDSLFNLPSVDDQAATADRVEEIVSTAQTVLGVQLPKDIITIFTREKAFRAAQAHWEQYLNWKKTRNPKRAENEAKYGYDTKHGMHLYRLELMGIEILEKHTVHVKWFGEQRERLMSIRRGEMEFDALVEGARQLEARAEELYKTSTLRKEPDRVSIDSFLVDMTGRYLHLNG